MQKQSLATLHTIFEDCYNLSIDEALCIKHLEKFSSILEQTRTQFNLIGNKENIDAHIIDSLAPLPIFLRETEHHKISNINITDLGTGAGFPGIPLAIAYESVGISSNWYLLERSQKKVAFLQSVLDSFSPAFSYAKIFVIPYNLREWRTPPHIHLLTYRAFKPFQQLIKDLQRIAPHATLLLYKGKQTSIEEELNPFNNSTITIDQIHTLEHEHNKERHLVQAHWV